MSLWEADGAPVPAVSPTDRVGHAQLAREMGVTTVALTKIVSHNQWLGADPQRHAGNHVSYSLEAAERLKMLYRAPTRITVDDWLTDHQEGSTHVTTRTTPPASHDRHRRL